MVIERNCPYFMFSKEAAQDERLTLAARGLLCYLESIDHHSDIDRDYPALINELLDFGYLLRNCDGSYRVVS